MTTVDATRQASIQSVADYVYNVQEDLPEKTTKDEVQELGQNIIYGMPLMVGAPIVMKYAQRPFSIWQYKQKNPGMSWSQASDFLSNQRAQQKQALEYLKDPNSRWLTMKNRQMFRTIEGLNSTIPGYNTIQDVSKLQGKELLKYQNAQRSSKYYGDARKLIEEAKAKKMTGNELKAQLKKIYEAMRKGDARVNTAMEKGLIKPTSKFGKAKHWVKSKTGGYKFESKFLKSAKGANALRTAKKFAKGGMGIMAIIEGVCEIPDIISAFQIDSKRGTKQVAKSGVKVASSVLGYAAGSAATGAVVGSVFPGIGNAVGAAIGFVGGLIGGWLASKASGAVMDKALGEKDSLNKSEAQVYEEEQNAKNKQLAKEAAQEAGSSNDALDQLLAMADYKAGEEGEISSQEVLDAFENLVQERESAVGTEYTDQVNENVATGAIQGYDDWYLYQLNNLGKNIYSYA